LSHPQPALGMEPRPSAQLPDLGAGCRGGAAGRQHLARGRIRSRGGGARAHAGKAGVEAMKPRSARVFEWIAIQASRRWLALGLLLMSISLASAATTTDSGVTGGSLAGQLLIASPDMDDPRFAQTVILMVQHNKDGALGIIINRPVGELSYAELLKSIGEHGSAANGKVRIYAGGPVQLNAGFVLH